MKTLSLEIRDSATAQERQKACTEWNGWLNRRIPSYECELTPERFEATLIGEWEFLARCVRQGACGWQVDLQDRWPVIRWRFYAEGLLWEERSDDQGSWFPYSVYRSSGELFIVRNPRPEPVGQIFRYGLARVNRRFLWLYEPPFDDEECPPCHGLLFRRQGRRKSLVVPSRRAKRP